MKDGRTHLAYKVEHAVDLEQGAVVAVTVTVATGDAGDTETMLMSTPPTMVIQQSMVRIASFYHASVTTSLANQRDFFNTHA